MNESDYEHEVERMGRYCARMLEELDQYHHLSDVVNIEVTHHRFSGAEMGLVLDVLKYCPKDDWQSIINDVGYDAELHFEKAMRALVYEGFTTDVWGVAKRIQTDRSLSGNGFRFGPPLVEKTK